jgi:hypothetical protein
MLNTLITIKASTILLALALTSIISTAITVSVVKPPSLQNNPYLCTSQTPEEKAAAKRYFHVIKINTKDGTRY